MLLSPAMLFSGTVDLSGVADSDSVSIYGGVGSSASVPLQYSSTFIKDVVGPSVDSVAISSVTGAQNNRLNTGDVVSVTVTLDDSSIVTGSPVIALTIGSSYRQCYLCKRHGQREFAIPIHGTDQRRG